MKRRELIKLGILGSAGILVGCGGGSSSNPSPSPDPNITIDDQIIVIGAGISGMAAAHRLQQRGKKVVVLEARDRIGGRVWTDRNALGFPFDMGAGWIHGPSPQNPLTKLAQDAGARTYLTNDESFVMYDRDGKEVPSATFTSTTANYRSLKAQFVSSRASISTDIPLSQAFSQIRPNYLQEQFTQWALTSYDEFDTGGPLEQISAKNWQTGEKFEGKDVLFPEGYEIIFKNFASIEPKLNTVVSQIEYNSQGVIVTTDKGKFTGKQCLITLPLGVLKKGDVKFSPELPDDKKALISKMIMGYVNKVVLVFDQPFWDIATQYFGYDAAEKGMYSYFLNLRTFTNVNGLVTFGFGNYGLKLESQTNEQISQDAMVFLRRMFGSTIPSPTKIAVTRWSADKYAYGAYSFPNVGTSIDDFENFGKTVQNKLFFAGEHTSRLYNGTVHGAYLSGIREADKILSL